jgi:O-antigen ligase
VITVGVLQFLSAVVLDSNLRTVVAETQGKDATLAGRTDLWEAVLKEGDAHPLLGAGYGGFWSERMVDHMHDIFSWGPGQSHNGYIETYLNLGLVGLALLIASAFKGLRSALRHCCSDFDHGVWRLILLLCTLIHNYSEAGFPRPTHVVWFVFLTVLVEPIQPANKRAVYSDLENDGAADLAPFNSRLLSMR